MKVMTAHAGPYPGLRFYSEGDAPFFFGRERLRELIISNLKASRLTLVFGPSGVGKSSILHAGVANKLRSLVQENLAETGTPEFAVAVFNGWRDDPLVGLTAVVEEATRQAVGGKALEPPSPSSSFVEKLGACAKQVGGDLLIILDQFEDYFLYHGHEDGEFLHEFARAVNDPALRVNFLVSIRDDAYSKLEYFKAKISNIYANSLRIEHLNTEAARLAIEKPIDQYNRFYAAGKQRMSIESELIEEVLKTVRTGRLTLGEAGRGIIKRQGAGTRSETTIEAPFLQLVMTELWKAEMLAGSTTLRLHTLSNLGGAEAIVRTHLARVMDRLPEGEKMLAAGAFSFLVTSSGNKIAYTASDLAESAELDRNKLVLMLEKLAGSGARILRSSPSFDHDSESRYEIFHDVLAKAVLDWRIHYRQQQKLEQEKRQAAEKARAQEEAKYIGRLRLLAVSLAVALVLAIGATIVAFIYYFKADAARHQAVAAGNVHSEIIADLYKVIIQPTDPKKAIENLEETLQTLNEARELYEQDNNLAGAGITRNNIGGLYKAAGQSEAGLEHYEKSQEYYQKAHEYFERARELLKMDLGPAHPDVATSNNELGDVDIRTGKYAEAEEHFKQSFQILKKAFGADDRYVADAAMNLAECYNVEGKYDEAEKLYAATAEFRRRILGEDHREVLQSSTGLASLQLERGKYSDAERRFNEALQASKNSSKALPLDAVPIYNGLAAIYRVQGKYAEAEQYLKQARQANRDLTDQNHLVVAEDLENLALLRKAQSNPEAQGLFELVRGIRTNALGADHPDTARSSSNLALFHLRQGNYEKAEELFNQAREVQQAVPTSPDFAQTLYGLARLYTDQSKYAEAEPLFKLALAIQQRAIPGHPDFADTLDAYAGLLSKIDRQPAADLMRSRAERVRQIHSKENPVN